MSHATPLLHSLKSTSASEAQKSPTLGRRVAAVVLGLLAVLILIALVASPIATWAANRKLANLPDYQGHIGAVTIALWKMGVQVTDLNLYDRKGEKELPLVKVKKASLRMTWSALLQGKLGGELKAESPEITVIKTETAQSNDGKDAKEKLKEVKEKIDPWRDALAKSFPMELTRLEVNDAKVHFIDRTHQPTPDLALEHLHLVATGLRNRSQGEELPAKIHIQGVTTGHGQLAIAVEADPLAKAPRFTTTMEVKQLSLPEWNNFLAAYANADVSSGTFEFYLEANAQGGGYQGYIKPFLKDVNFKTTSDKDKNAAQRLAKTAANAVLKVLKNKDENKVATKAPFSGTFDQNGVDLWTTVQNLLRNAFVQALREGFEGGASAKS
jgi:Domain of Unknown Function (DUF748)